MGRKFSEVVKAKTKLVGDCYLWQGTMNGEYPIVWFEHERYNLRVYAVRKEYPNLDPRKQTLVTTCGNPNCINKAHIVLADKKKYTDRTSIVKQKRKRVLLGDIALVQSVFNFLVTDGVKKVAAKLDLTIATVERISQQKCMFPYFQLRLQRHLKDVTIQSIRESGLTDKEIKRKYGLKAFAINFIRSGENYPLHDEDLYLRLLDRCTPYGDHLVWVGKRHGDKPVEKEFGGRYRRVISLFMYATIGWDIKGRYETTCGCPDCINPYHCGVADDYINLVAKGESVLPIKTVEDVERVIKPSNTGKLSPDEI